MPEIKLTHITKRWGKFFGVDDLSLDIPDNSFITLLGPSGCGKTTILRMIAGLETPTTGQIRIGDRVVFDSEKGINIPANKRKVGFLFQNYALWPNMTVYQNISFGLSNIRESLPKINFEAKTASDLIRALRSGRKITELVEDCRDKKGKLDVDKVYLKMIDAFTISQYTAKTLYDMKIQEASDPDAAAREKSAEQEKKLAEIRETCKNNGQELNAEFAVVSGGKVQTEVRKLTKEEVDLAVRRVSRVVKIGMFMERYPAELSGGQQQRVAIARTLAPEPDVLFMDEPLSNLDAKLRLEMRYELQRLHVETGSTFVYVTHDQMEAMTLATKICLINNGVLQQYQAPLEVYNRPSNLFVADFVGNPSINFVEGKGRQEADGSVKLSVLDGVKAVFHPESDLDLTAWFHARNQAEAEADAVRQEKMKDKKFVEKSNKDETFRYHVQKVEEEDYSIEDEPVITDEDLVLGIRPECIKILENGSLDATVYGAMPTGMESTVKLCVGDFLLTGVIFGGVTFKISEKVRMDIQGSDILLFDRKSGKCISAGTLTIEK
ncbi:MAG: ABC transporter ATP-binding protein [Lachnospiraceae bacterium]|nr:ABC transporter ATP-binding protein [Lachnospiraceae bacterium]